MKHATFTRTDRIPVAVFRSPDHQGHCMTRQKRGQLICQCVATGLIKAKTKVSRRFYTQPVCPEKSFGTVQNQTCEKSYHRLRLICSFCFVSNRIR